MTYCNFILQPRKNKNSPSVLRFPRQVFLRLKGEAGGTLSGQKFKVGYYVWTMLLPWWMGVRYG